MTGEIEGALGRLLGRAKECSPADGTLADGGGTLGRPDGKVSGRTDPGGVGTTKVTSEADEGTRMVLKLSESVNLTAGVLRLRDRGVPGLGVATGGKSDPTILPGSGKAES